LGWLLEALPAKVKVNLRSEGMVAHTAIIAQSGSGKSFMLGRLLEEIASKTQARVVIIDPNSDFAQFGTVADDGWKFEKGDSRQAFKDRWDRVGFCNLTSRPAATVAEPSKPFVSAISLSWPELPEIAKASLLGLSLRTHPEEFSAIRVIESAGGLCTQLVNGPYSLDRWAERVQGMRTILEFGGSTPEMRRTWPTARLTGQNDVPSLPVVVNIALRIEQLRCYDIWDKDIRSVGQRMAPLCGTDTDVRVVCLDLGSLDQPEQRFITAAAALDSLWVNARAAWTKALAAPQDQDRRCPVFVVIDEAHNIAPEESVTEVGRPTLEILVRIAMEGRKYGLFLILVTQRPARVNSNLMSQCDNLVLMKMSNPADVRLAQERFGFVPAGWAERALEFEKGQMLLSGQFVERPVYAKVAPRRTVEGGRSLQDAVWLTDPRQIAGEQGALGQAAEKK
jgi:DNA helicase HerA-like ATPase